MVRMQHPTHPEADVSLSATEFSMLQQIRMLGSGLYVLTLTKANAGRDGLTAFRVVETGSLTRE
jgi:hypothetical protein